MPIYRIRDSIADQARLKSIFAWLALIVLTLAFPFTAIGQAVTAQNARVYFSPQGGCTEAVIRALDEAKASVLIQAYSFTSAPIAQAVVNAHKRGVKVEVILDKSNKTANYSAADFVTHAGIPTYIDSPCGIAHSKVMVIDKAMIVTGSFNYSKVAEERNVENLLVIHSPELAALYVQNWESRCRLSTPYQAR